MRILSAAWQRVKPPTDLRARIRWLFVIGSLANLCLLLIGLIFVSGAPIPLRLLASGVLALTGFEVIRGYQRLRWPRYIPLLELLALGLATISIGDARHTDQVFYIGMYFRSLYGGVWEIVVLVCTYLAAYLASA